MTIVGDSGKMITVVMVASLWLCQYNIGQRWQDYCGGGGFIVAVSYSAVTGLIRECCIVGIGNQRASGAIRRMLGRKTKVGNDGGIVICWIGWLVGDVELKK